MDPNSTIILFETFAIIFGIIVVIRIRNNLMRIKLTKNVLCVNLKSNIVTFMCRIS